MDPDGPGPGSTEVEITCAGPGDVRTILRLVDRAGWAYTRSEVERLIAIQPQGMLVARPEGSSGRSVACVYASRWGALGFIGLMLVEEGFRRRGVGTQLLDRGVRDLRERGCTSVGLDAVPDAVGFYARLGFVAAWESLRFGIDTNRKALAGYRGRARRCDRRGLPDVLGLDLTGWGADRSALLRRMAVDKDVRILVAPATGSTRAFGALRKSKGALRLGPLVAEPTQEGSEAARAVLAMAIELARPQMLTLGVPSYNKVAVEVLKDLGASTFTSCTRMYLGDPGPARAAGGSWAIGAAEKG
jgi:GNAT superfamily N-acetyltransferase